MLRASTPQAVSAAKTRIELIVDAATERLPYTHFLSIPLPGCVANVAAWKGEVLAKPAADVGDVSEELFNEPKQLHLTLLMLKL